MSHQQSKNLEVTTLGWDFPQWQDAFYPDDLPQEWLLDYYLNQFRLIAVPETEWLQWLENETETSDAFDDFVDCLNDDSTFILCGSEQKQQELISLVKVLTETEYADRIVACIIHAEKSLPSQTIQNIPVTLISNDLKLAGWSWQKDGVIVSGEPILWLEKLPKEGKQQAEFVQDLIGSVKSSGYELKAICVADPEVGFEEIKGLQTIVELFGL